MAIDGKEDDPSKVQTADVLSQEPKLLSENGELTAKKLEEDQNRSLPKENSIDQSDKKNVKEDDSKDKEITKDDDNNDEIAKKNEKGESSSSPSSAAGEEEHGFLSVLRDHERRALIDLKSRLEEAILTNKLFDKKAEQPHSDKKHESNKSEEAENSDKGKEVAVERSEHESPVEVDKDISLWGVPLLPSKGDEALDILLYKFLMAREFKASDAFEMLRNTLVWRKENKIDSIMDEDMGNDYDSVGYMKGYDREGHPVCYNVYGVFADEAMYNKTFGTEASRDKFLRWRIQLLEKEIKKLDFRPGGVSKLLQVTDLKNAPGPSRSVIRAETKRAVGILQDNYPEFVDKNIFINVPFWYYAFNVILSTFLTQRTTSKFVFSRPSRVTETLLKYVAAEEIPIEYGGLRRENDPEFSIKDAALEVSVKAGATETIEIAAPEVGSNLMWDVSIVNWDVNYKEEFVPTDEGSYTLIVKKGRKISWQQEPIRNSFITKEPGKLVITIDNTIFKKKRVLYRYKINNNHASSKTTSNA